MGNSLLVDASNACSTDSTSVDCNTDPTNNLGALDIQPNSKDMSVNMEVSDTVEITGTCRDLGRKNNRILVQVFAGDLNEAGDPYIDNTTSSKCLDASSGIAVGEKCFNVTKGIGLKEDAGLPDEKVYPQCHNGQFGFSVRLGKILKNVTTGVNYLVRFKLRTQEGSLNDTVWSRVTVTRGLTAPVINSIAVNQLTYQCTLANSVARFNQSIGYALMRSYNLFGGGTTTALPVAGFGSTSASPLAYSFTDSPLVEGVTYNYSIVSTENQYNAVTEYGGTAPTTTSNSVTCEIPKPRPYLYQSPTAGTCYLAVVQANAITAGQSYQIGSLTTSWVSQGGTPGAAFCTSGSLSSGNCVISGLASGVTYYFSVRAHRGAAIGTDEFGKWGDEVPCKPL